MIAKMREQIEQLIDSMDSVVDQAYVTTIMQMKSREGITNEDFFAAITSLRDAKAIVELTPKVGRFVKQILKLEEDVRADESLRENQLHPAECYTTLLAIINIIQIQAADTTPDIDAINTTVKKLEELTEVMHRITKDAMATQTLARNVLELLHLKTRTLTESRVVLDYAQTQLDFIELTYNLTVEQIADLTGHQPVVMGTIDANAKREGSLH